MLKFLDSAFNVYLFDKLFVSLIIIQLINAYEIFFSFFIKNNLFLLK